MRGSPVARAIVTVIALLALLLPLRRLTSHQSATVSPPPAQVSTAKKKLHLELTSTTVPFKFQVTHGGEPIWSGESTSTTIATDTELRFPPEGIDLVRDLFDQVIFLNGELVAFGDTGVVFTAENVQKTFQTQIFSGSAHEPDLAV